MRLMPFFTTAIAPSDVSPQANMGGDREAGVVIDQLQDQVYATAGGNVFDAVQLPTRVRSRVDEPPV